MGRKLFLLAALFLLVKAFGIHAYRGTAYFYGMVENQFLIAEAAFKGHPFSQDLVLGEHVRGLSNRENRFIPLEDYKSLPGSGTYTTFPAQDLPGLGYLMAATSRLFGGELTSRWAFLLQGALELASLLVLASCVAALWGEGMGLLVGLLYLFFYPYLWVLSCQPMRDSWSLPVYVSCLAAFTLFLKRPGFSWALPAAALLAFAGLLLWVRPSPYYFPFLLALLAPLAGSKPWKQRILFMGLALLLPLLLFGAPLKRFNLKYYGMADTDVLGRGLWEGMGVIPDNPYGFVLDDAALVPWCKSRGHDLGYSTPAMNHLLGDYARGVIREDPGYYLKTILARLRLVRETPLHIFPPRRYPSREESGMGYGEYLVKYPLGFLFKLWSNLNPPRVFFFGGFLLLGLMCWLDRGRRLAALVLGAPALYALGTQIPIHFEPRSMATGAWALALPWAWGLGRLAFLFSPGKGRRSAPSPGRAAPPIDFGRHSRTYRGKVQDSIAFLGRDLDFFTQAKAQVLEDLLQRKFPSPGKLKVLDVGCGVGLTDRCLGGRVGKLYGMDLSRSLLAQARRENPGVTYRLGKGKKLPFKDNSMDVVFAICVLHHVPLKNMQGFIREMRRVTRKGGWVVVFEHNPLNPLTRAAVDRCDLDDDAILLRMDKAKELMRGGALGSLEGRYILFLPFGGSGLRRWEGALGWLPLGAQYYVAGKK